MISTIGNNIKKLRTERNMTQEQLANSLNISYQAVSKWENGVAIPDTMILPSIASVFDITIDELFKNSMKIYRNLADRYASIYEMTRNLDDFIQAEKENRKLIESGKSSREDLRSRGIIFEWCAYEAIDEALKCYKKVLESKIKDETYYLTQRQMAYFRSRLHRNDENIEEYEKLIQNEPEDINNYYPLIQAYCFSGNFQKALTVIKECLKREPNDPMTLHYAGNVYENIGNNDEALKYWERSFSIDPELLANQYSRADLYEKLGELKNAIKIYQEIQIWMEERGFDIEVEDPRRNIKRLMEKLDSNS